MRLLFITQPLIICRSRGFGKSQGSSAREGRASRLERRVEAHILIAFLAYCLTVTLKHRLQRHAPGLTSRAVLEKLAAIQMLDVSFPTTDGRTLVMPRYTEPDADQALVLHQLNLVLPQQPPPKITTRAASHPIPQLKM